jgi:hypothetical protein
MPRGQIEQHEQQGGLRIADESSLWLLFAACLYLGSSLAQSHYSYIYLVVYPTSQLYYTMY